MDGGRHDKHALLMENRTLEVWSIPLRHRVPTAGFLFREKEPALNVDKFKIMKYGLSVAQITAAKRGEDVTLSTGEVIPNGELTYRPYAPGRTPTCRTPTFRPRPQRWPQTPT